MMFMMEVNLGNLRVLYVHIRCRDAWLVVLIVNQVLKRKNLSRLPKSLCIFAEFILVQNHLAFIKMQLHHTLYNKRYPPTCFSFSLTAFSFY